MLLTNGALTMKPSGVAGAVLTSVLAGSATAADVSAKDLPAKDLPAKDLPANDLPAKPPVHAAPFRPAQR